MSFCERFIPFSHLFGQSGSVKLALIGFVLKLVQAGLALEGLN